MELSRDDFKVCKSITLDKNYAAPKIRMCRDMNNKQLIHEFECKTPKGAEELFNSLLSTWKIVKGGMIDGV